MEDYLFVIKSVLNVDSAGSQAKLRLLLKLCDEHQVFCGQPLKIISSVVSGINTKLGSKESRFIGILVLETFITQCPESTFNEYVVDWMDQCVKEVPKSKAYGTLRIMFQMVSKLPVVPNGVVANIIPKLLMKICEQEELSVPGFQCLEAMLMHFPKTCKPSLRGVWRLLSRACDAADVRVARWAGLCGACACAVSGWGVAWAAMVAGAGAAVDELLALAPAARVFPAPPASAPDPALEDHDGATLRPPPLPTGGGELCRAHALSTRVGNLVEMMAAMLRCEVALVKEMRVEDVVLLALKALSVRPQLLQCESDEGDGAGAVGGGMAERMALAGALPILHCYAFRLLTALVVSCNAGLLKFGPVFCKMVLQTLKWSSATESFGTKRPFAKVREAACVFLEHWCIRAQASSCVELFGEELVNILLTQVILTKETIYLKVGDTNLKTITSFGNRLCDAAREEENDAAAAALGALAALVQASGALLGPRIHARTQAACVALELSLRRVGGDWSAPPPTLGSPTARINLHRLLLALSLHPAPRWPVPTPFAVQLAAEARGDPHPQVRACGARAAAAAAQALLRPDRSRALRLPLDEEDLRDAAGLPPLTARAAPAAPAPTSAGKRSLKRQRQLERAQEHKTGEEEAKAGEGAVEDEPQMKKKKKKKQQHQLDDSSEPPVPVLVTGKCISPDAVPKKKKPRTSLVSPTLSATPPHRRRSVGSRASNPRLSAGGNWVVEEVSLPCTPHEVKLPAEDVSIDPQPIVELSPPTPTAPQSTVRIVEVVEVDGEEMKQVAPEDSPTEEEWLAPLVDLADTDSDGSMSIENDVVTKVMAPNEAKKVEGKAVQKETEVVDLEDKAEEEESKVMEHKAVGVVNEVIDVEDKVVDLEDKVVDVEDKVVDVEDKVVDVEDKVVDVEDKVVDVEDKVVDVEDKVVDVEDKVVDVEDKVVDVEDKVVDVEDNVIDVEGNAIEVKANAVEGKLVDANASKPLEEKKETLAGRDGAKRAAIPEGGNEGAPSAATAQEEKDEEEDMLSAFVDVASDAAN